MKELLEFAAGLVSGSGRVQVSEAEAAGVKKYLIEAEPGDIKNIIGREGKTIKAIRSLVSMASINRNIKQKIPVEIVEK